MDQQARARFQIKCLLAELGQPNCEINDWEENFIMSIAERIEHDSAMQLSEKQIDVIERIFKDRQND